MVSNIFIIFGHHQHHVALPAQISLTLSRHQSIIHCFGGYTMYRHRGSSWLSCLCSSMWKGPQEYVAYELVLTSPAVSCMSGSSNLGSFHDGWPYSYCFERCCLQDWFNIAHSILVQLPSSFFSLRLVSIHLVHPYSSIDINAAFIQPIAYW